MCTSHISCISMYFKAVTSFATFVLASFDNKTVKHTSCRQFVAILINCYFQHVCRVGQLHCVVFLLEIASIII